MLEQSSSNNRFCKIAIGTCKLCIFKEITFKIFLGMISLTDIILNKLWHYFFMFWALVKLLTTCIYKHIMRRSRIFFSEGGGGGSEGLLCLPEGEGGVPIIFAIILLSKFNKFSFCSGVGTPPPTPSRSAHGDTLLAAALPPAIFTISITWFFLWKTRLIMAE